MNISCVMSRKIVEYATHSFLISICLLILSEMNTFHGCLLFNAAYVYDDSSARAI